MHFISWGLFSFFWFVFFSLDRGREVYRLHSTIWMINGSPVQRKRNSVGRRSFLFFREEEKTGNYQQGSLDALATTTSEEPRYL